MLDPEAECTTAEAAVDRVDAIAGDPFQQQAPPGAPDDLLRSYRRGLLLKRVTGYGINPVNGSFSGGAFGFWIEDGAIAFPVEGLTVAGTAAEIFAGIDLVANDLDLNRTLTAPTFRVTEMQIGGE
jgi:PmbA protein